MLCAGFLIGCSQKDKAPPPPKNAVSLENLQTAYEVSLKRQRMYDKFIPQAEDEKLSGVASLYRALSASEGIHARLHAELMRKDSIEPVDPIFDSVVVGSAMQTLKMALSCEELEFSSMYPSLLRAAMAEEYAEGVDQFNAIQSVEERHVELLKDAQDRSGRIGKVKFFVCPGDGYIFTTDKTEECPVCKSTKDKFIAI
jgi:rubrerythrin